MQNIEYVQIHQYIDEKNYGQLGPFIYIYFFRC